MDEKPDGTSQPVYGFQTNLSKENRSRVRKHLHSYGKYGENFNYNLISCVEHFSHQLSHLYWFNPKWHEEEEPAPSLGGMGYYNI